MPLGKDYEDLYLMTLTEHHVIANSTYSLWGAYLTKKPGITIAPSYWYKDTPAKDLYINNLNKDGHDIELIMHPFDNHIENDDNEFIESFKTDLQNDAPDLVMSFNYHPAVSKACNESGIKYAAWVYDNPASRLFSYTLVNPCNYVFLFDSQVFEMFASQGIKTVYYLPLASAVSRYDGISVSEEDQKKWCGKISFVGSLYNESHNYYDQIEP